VTYVKTLLEESGEIGDSRRANVWPPEYEVGLYDYSTKLSTRERRERILKQEMWCFILYVITMILKQRGRMCEECDDRSVESRMVLTFPDGISSH
jgi:hypothetical protein